MEAPGRRRILVAVVGSILTIAAATNDWAAGKMKGEKKTPEAPPRKVLVVVVSPETTMRAGFEDVIAGELALRGTAAVASHLVFPELPKERGPFEAKVAAEGFDAVTVSRVVGKDDKVEWKEATAVYDANYVGQDYWGGYWYTYNQAILPGYLEHEMRVRVRTDLWRVAAGKAGPSWSGTSELLDPTTLAQAAHDVAVSIVKSLAKAKLI